MTERTPRPAVLLTKADIGEGVEILVKHIDEFLAAARESGRLATRRLAHLEREALELIGVQARRQTMQALDPAAIAGFSQALRERRIDPATVAARALALALANADFRCAQQDGRTS